MPLEARIDHHGTESQPLSILWPGGSRTLVCYPEENHRRLIWFACRKLDNGGLVQTIDEEVEGDKFVERSRKLEIVKPNDTYSAEIPVSAAHMGTLVLEHSCWMSAQ